MAHTNETNNYGLPQFIGTDKASWLGDINPAMLAIDTGMNENKTNSETAISSAQNAVNVATTANNVANQALTTASGFNWKPLQVLSVAGSPLVTLPTANITENNQMLNIHGNSDFNPVVLPKTQKLFKLQIAPKNRRFINILFQFTFIKNGEHQYFYTHALLHEDGTVGLPDDTDFTAYAGMQLAVYIQRILVTNGWF